jgi:DNA-binding NarL/FixJ family response regulator
MKLIIADDHELLLDTLVQSLSLRFSQLEIKKVKNKEELYSKIQQENFDFLLQDVRFGDTDARNFIPEISIKHPQLKIIVFTSISDQLSLSRISKLPIHALVSKTDSIDEIIQALNHKNTNEIYFSAAISSILKSVKEDQSTQLSERELEVLREISNGKTSKEISEHLFISIKTVEMHRSNLFSKLDVSNVVSLVKKAITLNLIDE